MKMNLKWIAAIALSVAATYATAQTSIPAEGRIVAAEEVQEVAPAGGNSLVLEAGGVRRVIARIALTDPHTLRVQLSNLAEYQTAITVVAPDGSVRWEQELVSQSAFAKNLDLKTLFVEPGIYTLRVRAGAANLEQELVVKNRSVTLGMLRHSTAVPGTPAMAGK